VQRNPGRSKCSPDSHPKTMQRHTVKPWRGPLPPVRCFIPRSLGDLLVSDRRAGCVGLLVKLADVANEGASSPPGKSLEMETMTK
jgi:hypothetical protein